VDSSLVSIMQPTYLPWCGYFDLIDRVSTFIFLDTVQFNKRSWQQRNRIRSKEGLIWLTVPVKVKGRYHQLIKDVEISDSLFYRKHLKTIELNYKKAPFFYKYFEQFIWLFNQEFTSLLELNISLIKLITRLLNINNTNFLMASDLGIIGKKRGEYLAELCHIVQGKNYLTPVGSLPYLMKDKIYFSNKNIQIFIHNYSHPVYQQVFQPFIPYMSIIDLLFNEGHKALSILKSGRKPSISLSSFYENEKEYDSKTFEP